jgi:hypothetical protein
MADRRYLYVFTGPLRPLFTIYHDDRPSLEMLARMPAVLFHDEIAPGELLTLAECEAEFGRQVQAGEITPAVGGRA